MRITQTTSHGIYSFNVSSNPQGYVAEVWYWSHNPVSESNEQNLLIENKTDNYYEAKQLTLKNYEDFKSLNFPKQNLQTKKLTYGDYLKCHGKTLRENPMKNGQKKRMTETYINYATINPKNQTEKNLIMVKGKGYQKPFLTGGHVHFELTEYVSCSIDWVLDKDWQYLKIKPLNNG